mgnify:CR=1 FL=1
MSKRSWVCFDCRRAVRREATYSYSHQEVESATCAECERPCEFLGYKIRIPPRSDIRAWESLRADLAQQEAARQQARAQWIVEDRHDTERQIVELESRPANPGRDRLIRDLKARLDRT